MKLNCFESMEDLSHLRVTSYSISGIDSRVEKSERYKKAWKLCRAFEEKTAVPCKGAEEIIVAGCGPDQIETGEIKASKKETKSFDPQNPLMRSALQDMINEKIDTRMYHQGFQEENSLYIPQKGNIYRGNMGEPFLVYSDGCRYQIEILQTGHVLVWIDPKGRIKQRASDFIEWKENYSKKGDVEKELIGEKVKVEPYNTTGEIMDIQWNETVSTQKIPTSELGIDVEEEEISLREYWKRTHGIHLTENEGPIIQVKLNTREMELSYPPSQVYISTKNKSIPKGIREKFSYPSVKRVGKTEKLASTILGHPLEIGDKTIRFETEMATEDRLKKIGKLKSKGKINEPSYLIGDTKSVQDPKKIKSHGPFSGTKTISIHYVYPENINFDIDLLHEKLAEFFESFNLGKLEKIGDTPVSFECQKPDRNDYSFATGKAIEKIDDELKNDTVIFSVTIGDKETYAGGKQETHEKGYIIQNMKEKTAKDIVKGNYGDYPMAVNTLLQVYLKTLDKGEAPWILEHPAGDKKGTAYVGYDVSRRQDKEKGKRREAAATISMVDNLGRHISEKFYTTQSGEKLDKTSAKSLIFDLGRSANRTFDEYGIDLKRMVLFKDGTIRSNEKENVQAGVEESIDSIVSKEDLPDSISVELIGVVKSNIERLYQDNGYNPDRGTYLVFSDGAGVISTSKLSGNKKSKVTVQTTKLEPKFKTSGTTKNKAEKIEMESILHEFSDLCFLDWASIYHQPKYPIVLKLAQQLGEQYTLNIGDPSYLAL